MMNGENLILQMRCTTDGAAGINSIRPTWHLYEQILLAQCTIKQ